MFSDAKSLFIQPQLNKSASFMRCVHGTRWVACTRWALWIGIGLLVLALNACTSMRMAGMSNDGLAAPAEDVDKGIPEQAPKYTYDSSSDSSQGSSSSSGQARRPPSGTVVALLNQAREQQRIGKPERAAAVLERALRLDPKNARLWHELAQIRLQQGLLDQAKSLAAKSSSLAHDDQDLIRSNDQLIAKVKSLQGISH